MNINEESLRICGVTSLEYLEWCKKNNLKPRDNETKQLFFKLIRERQLYRSKETGKIIYRGKEINAKKV